MKGKEIEVTQYIVECRALKSQVREEKKGKSNDLGNYDLAFLENAQSYWWSLQCGTPLEVLLWGSIITCYAPVC